MFIQIKRHGYDRHGQSFVHGRFLVLCQPAGWENRNAPIRAFACFARMHQFGQFMMANARFAGEAVTLSGSYGNDGLPRDVSQAQYDAAVPVPAGLIKAWNEGGGWNGAGSEAEAMLTWARQEFSPAPVAFEITYTDTFGGEANFSWVRREHITVPAHASPARLMRAAKAAVGLTGARGRSYHHGDYAEFRPHGSCTVLFATLSEG